MLERREILIGAAATLATTAAACRAQGGGPVSPMAFGARGDGVSDDTEAVRTALRQAFRSGLPLDAGDRLFAVSGNLDLEGFSRPWIRSLRLRQLRPAQERKTLHLRNCERIRIDALQIDVGSARAVGHMNHSAGLWVDGGAGHNVRNVTVSGAGKNSLIVIWNTSNSVYEDLVARDAAYDAPGAKDDVLQGIFIIRNRDCLFNRLVVTNLTGNARRGFHNRFSRGIALGGNVRCRLADASVSNVDQGIDFTGSDGNLECSVERGRLFQCTSVGLKFANTAVDCRASGVIAERCGTHGFLISGPSSRGLRHKTSGIELIDCMALDVGYNDFPSSKFGFGVEGSHFDQSYPNRCRLIRCRAIDRQQPRRMRFGFYNNITAGSDAFPNELIDCTSQGHLIAATSGKWR